MALIKCSECGKEFSDKANACPNCACPTNELIENNKNKKKKIKDYSELTSKEKASIRLYMRSKGENSTSSIILFSLGTACCLIGFFIGLWLLFFIIGICLYLSGFMIYSNQEKKYYYEHPESIDKKKKIIEENNNNFKKALPWMIGGILGIILGVSLVTLDTLKTIGAIILIFGVISYVIWLYLLITKTKR